MLLWTVTFSSSSPIPVDVYFVQICGENDTFKRAVRMEMSTDCPCLRGGVLYGSQLERCWRCWKTGCSHYKLSRRESVWCWAEWCRSAQLGPLLTLSQWSRCSHHAGLWQKPNDQKQFIIKTSSYDQSLHLHSPATSIGLAHPLPSKLP